MAFFFCPSPLKRIFYTQFFPSGTWLNTKPQKVPEGKKSLPQYYNQLKPIAAMIQASTFLADQAKKKKRRRAAYIIKPKAVSFGMLRLQGRFAPMQQQCLTLPSAAVIALVIYSSSAPPAPKAMAGRGADLTAYILGGISTPSLVMSIKAYHSEENHQAGNPVEIKEEKRLKQCLDLLNSDVSVNGGIDALHHLFPDDRSRSAWHQLPRSIIVINDIDTRFIAT